MNRIKSFGFALRQMRHFGSHHLQTGGFKTCVNLADDVFSDGVGLDDGKSPFDCHEFSLTLNFKFLRAGYSL